MSKKYVSVLKDSAATPGYRIIAPEDYVYTENGTKKVKKIDSKADKKVPATAGNLATLDSTGNLADSGKQTTDFMNALTTAYEASGSATKTVTKVTQAKTGAVAVTYSDIQSGTTSQKGLVQLEDSTSSTSVTKAATPNSVKSAYDLANGKYSKPSGGIPSSDMDSTVQASLGKADTAIQGVKLNGSTLTPSSAKVVDLGDLKTKQTAVSDPSASGTTITAIATISQDANGVITATKKTIQSASQSQDGVMSAADKKKLDGIATGAEVNQNAFSNVKVGDVTVAADAKTDTLTLAAGSNVTITPDATNDKITIAAKDTTYTADAGIRLDGTVFKHTNSVSGGTVGPTTDTAGATLSVPYVTYDSQGHVTASGTRTHNVGTASTSGAGIVQLQDSIDATATKAATPNAVKKAIEALDVSSVGGSGKYISAISESDGKISATSTTMDTTPTANSEKAVTSGGVKTALDDTVNVANSVIYTASGNTRAYYKLAETDVLQGYTSAILSCDYMVVPGAAHGERGELVLNFRVKDDTSWGLVDFYARQEYSTVASNYGVQFIYIAQKNSTGTHIDLYVSIASGLTGFILSRRFRKQGGTTLGDEWTFIATPTASSTAPTVPSGASTGTITPEIRDLVTLTSVDNIDNINTNTYAPKNFILKSTDWPAGTFPSELSATECYLQCFGHNNRQIQVLYVEINGSQKIYTRKAYGGTPPNLTWRTWQSERDASWINTGTFGTARIADDAITAAKVKDNEKLPVNISGYADTRKSWEVKNELLYSTYGYTEGSVLGWVKILRIERINMGAWLSVKVRGYFYNENSNYCSQPDTRLHFLMISNFQDNSFTLRLEGIPGATDMLRAVKVSDTVVELQANYANTYRKYWTYYTIESFASNWITVTRYSANTVATDSTPLFNTALDRQWNAWSYYSNYLLGTELTSSDDLNNYKVAQPGGNLHYYWYSATKPSNTPTGSNSCFMECDGGVSANQTTQILHPMGNDKNTVYYWIRSYDGSSWSNWKTIYYEATSTYSATGTQAVNGTAVASAISSAYPNKKFMLNKAVHGLLRLVKPSASSERMVLFRVTVSEAIPGQVDGTYIGTAYVTNTESSGVVNVTFVGRPDADYIKCKTEKNASELKVAFGHSTINNSRLGCIEVLYSNVEYEFIDEDGSAYTNNVDVNYTIYGSSLNSTIGSTSIPVYVDKNGKVTACTDDFVHDGDVVQTYSSSSTAPISGKGVTEKNLLKAVELDSSDSIDNLNDKMPVTTRGTRYWFWGPSSVTGTFPGEKKSFQLSVLVQHQALTYLTQELWYTDVYNSYHYIRKLVNGTWQAWKIHWDEATSSYSSSGTQPVNGTAVASAISSKSPTTHTHSVKINGTEKTIAASGGTAVDLGTYAPQFSLGWLGNTAPYTMFARMGMDNQWGNGEAQIIISSVVSYGDVNMGTWLVTVSNRGSTPSSPKATMVARCINRNSSTSLSPEFGYYYDTTNSYIYFGIHCPSYRGNNTITVLSNQGALLQSFGNSDTAPTGWTPITYTEYSVTTHTHGNIQSGGTLQTTDVAIASGDKLVITDSSDSSKVARASIAFDGSTTTKALTQKGTWETFNNYSLPLAASGTRGGIQIGYSESGTNYAVKLSSEKAYVTVPWTDTKVTQTVDDSTDSGFELLFSGTADNTTRTEIARKSSKLKFNPSTGTLGLGGTIARDLGSGVIAETDILYVSGSTDGLRLTYQAATSDAGVTRLGTRDDSNAKLSLGNWIGSTYKEAISIVNGSATVIGSLTGNATTATTADKLNSYSIAYHRPTSASGGDGKQWARLATLTENNISGSLYYGVEVTIDVYSNPYQKNAAYFGTYELSFGIGMGAGTATSLQTDGNVTVGELHGRTVEVTSDERNGIELCAVRSDNKVEYFIRNAMWDTEVQIVKVSEISTAGTRWVWNVEQGLYTGTEFTEYCTGKKKVNTTRVLSFTSNAVNITRVSNYNYNNWYQRNGFAIREIDKTGATNSPVADSWFYAMTMQGDDTKYCGQIALRMTGDTGLFIRNKKNDVWDSVWTKMISSKDVTSSYSSTDTNPVNGKAVAAAIGGLDVSSVGGDGKYISAISETDGKISATATTMDTTPTPSSTKAVTSGAIHDYLYKNVWTPATQGYGGYKQGLLSFVIPSGSAGQNGVKLDLVAYLAEDNQYGFTRYYISAKWKQDGTIDDGSIEVMYDKSFNPTNDSNKAKVFWSYDSSTSTIKVGVQAYAFAPMIKMHVVNCRAIWGNPIAWTSLVGTEGNFAKTIIPRSNARIGTAGTAVGSASVPVYAAADGRITACTDDFVHDGDITSTYSSTGTQAVNGTAVAQAVAKSYVATASNLSDNLRTLKIIELTLDQGTNSLNGVYFANGGANSGTAFFKISLTYTKSTHTVGSSDSVLWWTDRELSQAKLAYSVNTSTDTLTIYIKELGAWRIGQVRVLYANCEGSPKFDVLKMYDNTTATLPSSAAEFPVLKSRDASWINSGTFGTAFIADDAITAAKVKDNETLPVNISGYAASADQASLLTRTLTGSTISATNIVSVTGSTDGFKMDYSAASADAGKMTIYTTDDANAAISIGNTVSGTYKEAISIVNGSATLTGNCSGSSGSCTGNAATASKVACSGDAVGKSYVAMLSSNAAGNYDLRTTKYFTSWYDTNNGAILELGANGGTKSTERSGHLRLGNGAYQARILATDLTAHRDIYLPDASGKVVVTNRTTAIGNATNPVYVDASGTIQWCTSYGSATVGNTNNVKVTASDAQTYLTGVTTAPSASNQYLANVANANVYATAGKLHATAFDVNSKCTLQFNTTTNALDFVFA